MCVCAEEAREGERDGGVEVPSVREFGHEVGGEGIPVESRDVPNGLPVVVVHRATGPPSLWEARRVCVWTKVSSMCGSREHLIPLLV